MFDIGWSEFLFLAVLVLIVVGPQELPGLMRRLGQISSAIRNAALQFQLNLKALDRENSIWMSTNQNLGMNGILSILSLWRPFCSPLRTCCPI